MGFFDKLQKKSRETPQDAGSEELINALQQKLRDAIPKDVLDSMQAKVKKDMEKTMAPADVDTLEHQGAGNAALRQSVAERPAREKA